MTSDAVPNLAETREVDEEPFFEKGRHWIVEVGGFRELP